MWAIVQRDLVRALRRVTPYAVVFAVVTLLALVAVGVWPDGARPSMVEAAISSVALVFGTTFALLFCIMFIVPGYASSAILAEREQQTYELLAVTPIRPFSLVLGKYLNVMAVVGLGLLAAAPVLAVSFFLVGLDWAQIAFCGALILLTASACAAVGVMVSALHARSLHALVVSYGALFILFGGPIFMVAALLAAIDSPWMDLAFEIGALACPLGALILTMEGVTGLGALGVLLSLVYQAVLTVCALLIAYIRLLFPYSAPSAPVGGRKRGRALLRAVLWGSPWSGSYRPIADRMNPVFAVEWRWGALTGKSARIRLGIGFAVFSLVCGGIFLALMAYPDMRETSVFGMAMMQFAAVCIVAPALVANSLTKELEYGNLDLLRTSLLTPRRVVYGKWLAGAFSIWPLLAGFFLGHLALVPYYAVQPRLVCATVIAAGSAFVTAWVGTAIGILVSAVTRRTVVAVIISYFGLAVVVFGLFVATTLMIGFFEEVLRVSLGRWDTGQPLFETVVFLSPPAAFLRNATSGPVLPILREFSLYWIANIAFHLALGIALAEAATWWTGRRQMRGGEKP